MRSGVRFWAAPSRILRLARLLRGVRAFSGDTIDRLAVRASQLRELADLLDNVARDANVEEETK